MNWLAWVCIAVGVIVAVLASTGWYRYVYTGVLIAKVEPYTQPGGGAGSIYVVGDSTGYGTGASQAADSVVGRLGNDFTWYRIQNDSRNGRQIAGAQSVVESLTGPYDLLILQIGANDLIAGRPVGVIVADMQQLIESSRLLATHTIILTAGNIGAAPAFAGAEAERLTTASRDYDTAMRLLAREYQDVTFVSLFDEPAEDPFVSEPDVYLAADGLHPTSTGYAIWYQKARPYFAAVLRPESR